MFRHPNETVRSGQRFRIVRPFPGKDARGVLCIKDPVVCTEHWWDGRTLPCTENPETCVACRAGQPWRTASYSFFRDDLTDQVSILCLPWSGTQGLVRIWKERQNDLRGWAFIASRSGKTKRSAVKIFPSRDRVQPVSSLPKLPDLTAVLIAIWGVSDFDDLTPGLAAVKVN